jgi:5-oxoprolinase (ATP-hydrolysing) subunit A
MPEVDLNCDMGESTGAFRVGNDLAILPHVTSVNVACGFHGGDPSVMRQTVRAAVAHGVAIGAHPGLPDLIGFGRREMAVTIEETYDMVVYQIGALRGIAHAAGAHVGHVKPHGALYNMAARLPEHADAIARAIRDVDPALILVGLSGSALIEAGTAHGLRTVSEVFADRAYLVDGSLAPRGTPNAVLTDADLVATRAVRMVLDQQVDTVDGARIPVTADSICIHGDGPHAVDFARLVRQALDAAGITVRSATTRTRH